jgi:ribosomal protein S27AE
MASADGENTKCPKCGALAVRRLGFNTEKMDVTKDGTCGKCGEPLNMII